MRHADQPHYHVHFPLALQADECYITSSAAQIAVYLRDRGYSPLTATLQRRPLHACAQGRHHLALTQGTCPVHPPATDAELTLFFDATPQQMTAAGLTESEIARVCDLAVAASGYTWYPPELRVASHVDTLEA